MALTAQQILDATDIETREIDVPEWGGTVLVKGLSGAERDAYEASVRQFDNDGNPHMNLANARARLVARALVDDEGTRLFTDKQAGELGRKSAVVLERLFQAASEMSGLSESDVEEMAGNSDAAPSGDSPSDSPETLDEPELNS